MTEVQPVSLMTLPEVAKSLRLSEATVRWLRHRGEFPAAATLGRRLVWRRSDIDTWVAAHFERNGERA